MESPVLIERLVANMRRAHGALEALLETMRENRSAWIAIRPSALEASIAAMDAEARTAHVLEEERSAILAELGNALGIEGAVTMSALTDRVSPDAARKLREAGSALDKAARAVKVETMVGERLLASSRRIQDGLFQQAVRETDGNRPRSYDRSAHASKQSPRAGSLVDGLI